MSLRSMIPRLRWGGSYRDIGPVLKEWKADWLYRPVLEAKDLPAKVQTALAKATATLWTAAQQEAAELLAEGRAELAASWQASDELLHEALARLDVAEAETARLRERLRRLEASEDRSAVEAAPA